MSTSNGQAGKHHPYAALPPYAFWKSAVSDIPPFLVDPVVEPPFLISATDRVATAGSCFAQNIGRSLKGNGFNYFVAENAPDSMDAHTAQRHGYNMFSARYGNIYTVRQLVQLFDRAFGEFRPELSVWMESQDCFVDPFRPRIQPGGFPSEAALLADRERHFAAVRQLFQNLDVFVFTLGLTEAWRHKTDGAVIPIAPAVSGGKWDPAVYQFKNFTLDEVESDLENFVNRVRTVNSKSRILFTVSPVPLAATYEPRHVLCSTTVSKAILRLAVEKSIAKFSDVAYFPSFEIVTGPHANGKYFEDDLRGVTEIGVNHAMRVFFQRFAARPESLPEAPKWRSIGLELEALKDIVCDEDAITQAAFEQPDIPK